MILGIFLSNWHEP